MERKLFCLFTILVIIAAGSLSGCGGCSCQDESPDNKGGRNGAIRP